MTETTVDLTFGDSSGEGNDNGPLIDDPIDVVTVPPSAAPATTGRASTTTVALGGQAPETLTMTCAPQPAPVLIRCTWGALPSGMQPRLLRGVNGSPAGRTFSPAASTTTYEDLTVDTPLSYTYRLLAVASDGTVSATSPLVNVECCAS